MYFGRADGAVASNFDTRSQHDASNNKFSYPRACFEVGEPCASPPALSRHRFLVFSRIRFDFRTGRLGPAPLPFPLPDCLLLRIEEAVGADARLSIA